MDPWVALTLAIFVYDTWLLASGRESLTQRYQRACSAHPVRTTGFSLYLLAHLQGRIPRRVDAFSGYGQLATRRLRRA